MNIEELKAMLTADGADKDAIMESVLELVNAEKTKGIETYQKKDKEALKLKNAMKELGYDPDVDGDLDNFVTKSKSKKVDVESSKLTIAQMSEKLTTLETQMAQEKLRADTQRQRADREKINSKLTSTIGDKIFGSKYIIESLITNGKVKIVDDNVVFSEGDDIIPFDTGINKVLEENKEMLKVAQKNGGGSVKKDSNPSTMDFANMSVEEVMANIDSVRKQYMKK